MSARRSSCGGDPGSSVLMSSRRDCASSLRDSSITRCISRRLRESGSGSTSARSTECSASPPASVRGSSFSTCARAASVAGGFDETSVRASLEDASSGAAVVSDLPPLGLALSVLMSMSAPLR